MTLSPWLLLIIPAILVLLASRKKKDKKPAGPNAYHVKPLSTGWHLGPVVHGVNRTRGTSLVRTANGFRLKAPGEGGSLHAVQTRDISLVGKREIIIRYRITGDGAFVPTEADNRRNPARIVLVLQRNGDDWSGLDERRFYRLYSKSGDAIAPGDHVLQVPLLAENFGPVTGGGVMQSHIEANTRDMHSIHIGFGSAGGRAHGVYANGPAEFELLGIETN